MDSINANQPEATQQDLTAEAAVEKIRELVESAETRSTGTPWPVSR